MLTLDAIKGRMLDLDSHEWVPVARVGEVFGQRGLDVIASMPNFADPIAYNQGWHIDANHRDTVPITREIVWEMKGGAAPGALDFDRRPAVLDEMGISRQLVFPGMATLAMIQSQGGILTSASTEEREIGWRGIDAHNEWAASVTTKFDRLRVVGIVPATKPGITAEALAKDAARQIKMGIKAIMIDSGSPPAGVSSAHPSLDAFYATLAEANVPLVIHPPSGVGFVHDAWVRADPYPMATQCLWMAAENLIRQMVMGGVFERHPTLRFAAIELGAQWFGPMAAAMEIMVDHHKVPYQPATANAPKPGAGLSMRPSEYLKRNVRVTPYIWEPLDTWAGRYPHLQDCYCYSSDYPHTEGGQWSQKVFYDEVVPLGDAFVEKYFCSNAQLIVP
jgi:predicted TIM-barrel fold metal-dependent hydrolase